MLRVCNKCMTIYNDSSLKNICVKKCCHGEIVNIDEFIYPYVKTLNLEKSLPTDFSCSGHLYENANYGYISLNCDEILYRIAWYLRWRFPSYYSKSIPIKFLFKMVGLVYIRLIDNNNHLDNYEDSKHILEGIDNVIEDCLSPRFLDDKYDEIRLDNEDSIKDDRIKYYFYLNDRLEVRVQHKTWHDICIEFSHGDNTRTNKMMDFPEIPKIIIRMKPVSFESDDDIENLVLHLSELMDLAHYIDDIAPFDNLLDKIFEKKYKLTKTQQGRKYKLIKRTHLTK